LDPINSLRPIVTNEDKEISEFQEELVILVAQLIGDDMIRNYSEFGEHMTVKQANNYVEDVVARFLEAGSLALKVGPMNLPSFK